MQQQKSLKQQNTSLQNKIKQLQQQLDTLTQQTKNIHNNNNLQKNHTNDSTQTQDKNNTSSIQYSPIHTCESLQSQGMSIDMQHGRIPINKVTQTQWGKTLFQGTIQGYNDRQKNLIQQRQHKEEKQQLQLQEQQQIGQYVENQPLSNISECPHSISQLSKQQQYSQQQQQLPTPPYRHPLLQLSQHTHQPAPSTPIPLTTTKLLKKSIQLPPTSMKQSQHHLKTFYNSAIKQKNHCQQCLNRMHQLHEMEFLKNKYHRQYIALRAEIDKMKSSSNNVSQNNNNNNNNPQSQIYTPRSSLNLIQFYGQPLSSYNNNFNNDQKSQKSSFSFENIQNTLLSQRFVLQIEECIKLTDKLLLVEKKFIQLSQADYKLLMEFQGKIQKLKYHLGLETQPKFLQDLFLQLDKSQLTIKNIHEKYRKHIQKLCKSYKQKSKRTKEQFNQVNSVMILTLKDLNNIKLRNQRLQSEIQQLKGQLTQSKDMRSTNVGHQAMMGGVGELMKGSKDLVSSYQIINLCNKQKDVNQQQHVTISLQPHIAQSQLQKSSISSYGEVRSQKQFQKLQSKIKTLQRQNKGLQKTIKQLKFQISGMRKKSLSDFNQFINAIICNKQEQKRNIGIGTQVVDGQEGNNYDEFQKDNKHRNSQPAVKHMLSQVKEQQQQCQQRRSSSIKSQQQQHQQRSSHRSSSIQHHESFIQTLSTIIYQIFSFTSLETDESPSGIFQPQTQQQLIQMLQHIKHFTSKFDLYQKQKQKQISQVRKNFLQLLKFFIQHYKISQQQLLQQITKSSYNNKPLVNYIKNYYLRVIDNNINNNNNNIQIKINSYSNLNQRENNQRDSSSYTFGQKSQSCKDSQIQS